LRESAPGRAASLLATRFPQRKPSGPKEIFKPHAASHATEVVISVETERVAAAAPV